MKNFSNEQIEDMIRLRYGRCVTTSKHTAYVSYKILGKIFGVSGSKAYHICRKRFQEEQQKELPLIKQLQLVREK